MIFLFPFSLLLTAATVDYARCAQFTENRAVGTNRYLRHVYSINLLRSCFPHDESYFKNLVPNATITAVDPPMICLAQGAQPVRITGQHFFRYNADDDYPDDGGEGKFYVFYFVVSFISTFFA